MHALIAFYSGAGTDHRGRTLNGILSFTNHELETCHDYIQWLFPLTERSAFNPEAPVLNDETIATFQADPELQAALHGAVLRMLQFYGVLLRETPQGFELLAPQQVAQAHWMTMNNHNQQRLSRMLASLKLLGMDAHVAALWQGLQQLAVAYPESISAVMIMQWRMAAMGQIEAM